MAKNIALIQCVSLVICDDVIRDQVTNKAAIWGSFNEIYTRKLPAVHPRLCVFATLTSGRGTRNVGVAIEKANTGKALIELVGPMQFKSPLDLVDIVVVLQRMPIAEYGKYWVMVKEGGVTIGQRPFFVKKVKPHRAKKKRGNHDSDAS
jgi:hypothetical protein